MKKNFNLIGKYLRGDASLEERIQVMKWAEGNDTQRDEFNALRRIYDATLLMDDDIAMSERRTGLRRYWKWLAAAAVIAFVAGISYLPENFRDDPTPHLQFRSLSAPIGQQTKTVLSDGTVVWLNSGSELEICERAEGERRVKLCGEAYLDVARDIQIGLATEFHPAFALGPLADFQFRSGIEPYDRTVGKHRFGLLTDRRGERSELQVRRRIIPKIFREIRDACNESNDCRCCKPLPVTAEACPAFRHCNVIIHE